MQINLLSDTVTKPTQEMLKAMLNAEVGDDVFNADPTVNQLQAKIAELFGKEAALFFPSGTMANQVAIKIHTQPGEQLICDKWSHVYNYEGGGASFNSGVSCKLIDGHRGMFTAGQVLENISNREDIHQAITSLVVVENTANKAGGACWDVNELKRIKNICKEHGLAFHLDGARLFNALVAKDEEPKQYGALFDTISICLSKGLGCPVGSLLLGSKKHIKKALRYRKVLGGGMRQIGYLAAAGIYALNNHIERLAKDHRNAKRVSEVLKAVDYIKKVEPVETNIIIFYTKDFIDDVDFVNRLQIENILITGMGEGKLRMVFHLDVSDQMVEKLIQVLSKLKFK
ncbi:aminotransferase class I/II-fold pyridoxal phosphate-dependent enzyme [Aureibaculum marinum]|uniref:Aminotransferase class I/II-fold pyridoxal phosphate-dependent enzyme n=1 Tax=Aureibaculum marinum TaxID=2487930 RepID=A0A3N4P0T4_9FLAO|nr:GntG family PLP-dependent aldolase [Aureibaculum marinum]RPD98616.1 aminotransferase class I/II-fold pyridoxal phosphate-dependent enzyme [Aureibaculum marinum]